MMPPTFRADNAVKYLSLNVTIKPPTKVFRARLALGCWIIRFGGWVIGFGHINIKNIAAEARNDMPVKPA